ncbi:MAM domain-containing protein [Aphelenchoides besseyi]|nr:MAM domain-containing protein [Aphelenchoides besseyi]
MVLTSNVTNSCAPPMTLQEMLPQMAQATTKMFADTTYQMKTPLNLATQSRPISTAPLTDPIDLFCHNFDDKCRWRNMEGMLVDELDWYQGAGFLDESRLRLATGTHLAPDGYYGIAATDKVEFPLSKAILVSDIIDCQLGTAELRFMYWTSPDVRIIVCTKSVSKMFPDYDYCARPIENGNRFHFLLTCSYLKKIRSSVLGDPGPAYVTIPDLAGQSFQIYIRAENFVFQSPTLQGGFAIVDSIEYYGDFCPLSTTNLQNIQQPNVMNLQQGGPPQFSFLNNDQIEPLTPLFHEPSKNNSVNLWPLAHSVKTVEPTIQEPNLNIRQQTCQVLECSFNATEKCVHHLDDSQWVQSSHAVADIFGGIPGDASTLPWSKDGSFAYVMGPQQQATFRTGAFTVDEQLYFMFSYHKSVQIGDLKIHVKRRDAADEETIFEYPKTLSIESHRWYREVKPLEPGDYSYMAFEVSNLPMALTIGLDEFTLLDRHKQYYCRH